jgi:hypothetical protein
VNSERISWLVETSLEILMTLMRAQEMPDNSASNYQHKFDNMQQEDCICNNVSNRYRGVLTWA